MPAELELFNVGTEELVAAHVKVPAKIGNCLDVVEPVLAAESATGVEREQALEDCRLGLAAVDGPGEKAT